MDETKQEMQKGQQGMEKGLENVQKCQEDLRNSLEKKIDNVENKINIVEKKIEKKVEKEIEKIREQVGERIEGVSENFTLISERMEDLEKKLLAGENENKNKSMPVTAFPEPVLASPVPVTAFIGPVKLLTYDRKTNWERAVRMADVQNLKSALLYALKLEAATQASRRDRQSIRGARGTIVDPCESP
ncbi:hypothetical protein TNCV_2358661 [Trichonephila clavipes]|nr:hypothetical protein TNCV_2358661 [Trichonephila clavipes]